MQTDPVCGMQVDEQSAAAQSVFKDKTYFFCARSCKNKFEQSPQEFLDQTFQPVTVQPINRLHSKHVKDQIAELNRLDLPVSGRSNSGIKQTRSACQRHELRQLCRSD
jgi:YHS domain-containing protein